jgi:parvulin-like peptidyl-prolyl isomerase
MSMFRRFPLRLVLYGSIGIYLLLDLLFFNGPLRQTMDFSGPKPRIPEEWVARVSGVPITRSQLERAVNETLWIDGKSPSDLTETELDIVRRKSLDDLIDRALLEAQAKVLSSQLAVGDEELNERFSRFSNRFENKEALDAAMKSQGIADIESLRDRMKSQIREEKYIELRISPAIRISDEEIAQWFEENKETSINPERIEARHVFIPTLDHPPEEAKQKLDEALKNLIAKTKDFPTLVKELSEDPATRENGGHLGWMTRDRLPADFSAPVFSLEVGKPALVRSRLGWHLVEVTARKPTEPLTLEQAKPEILAALVAAKRRIAIGNLRNSLRQSSSGKVEIFKDAPTAR